MKKESEKVRFLVDLGDVKLPREAAEGLEKAIQRTAMEFIAKHYEEAEVAIKFKDLINGIIIRPDYRGIQAAVEEIKENPGVHNFLLGK